MKSYNNLWNKLISDENIKTALHSASLGNKNKKLKKRLKYMDEHSDIYIPMFRHIVENYRNGHHTPVTIYDGISRKKRTIIVPSATEQVVHHMVVNILKPIFMKPMYAHSYGSIPNRGAQGGKKTIEKWLPSKYVLKMDIRHYFDSVSQDVLVDMLERKIKDKKFLELLKTIISVTDNGIPLGFYTSQWFANFYLTELDHYIADELGYGHYIRYMDDMVVFNNNKKDLHRLRRQIQIYIKENLKLELKGNYQVFRFDYTNRNGKRIGRPLDFMGFKFYRDRTILRKSIMLKASRKAKRLAKKDKINHHDAAQMLSYLGWFTPTDTYNYFRKYVTPYVNIRNLKKKVSRYARKESARARKINYNRVSGTLT